MIKQSLKPLLTKPSKQGREKHAAYIKERIYGSVTVLAVNVGLLLHDDTTVQSAYITVASTIGGLWLASMFASVLSYRIIHDNAMKRREFIHELAVHRGLLFAAVPSMLMFSLAAFDVTSIKTAIIADIVLALIALTVTMIIAGKTERNSTKTVIVSIIIQAVIAGLIVLIKLGGEAV